MRTLGRGRILTVFVSTVASVGLFAPAANAEEVPAPTVTWDSTTWTGYVGTAVRLTGAYTSAPEGSTLRVESVTSGAGQPVANSVPLVNGRFSVSLKAPARPVRLKAVLSDATGDIAETQAATLTGAAAPVVLTLSMPKSARDYSSITAKTTLVAKDGRRLSDHVRLQFKRSGSKTWSKGLSVKVKDGRGSKRLKPRKDGRYRVVYGGSTTYKAKTSASRSFDNRPPGKVITLPKGASRPTVKLPKQPRASRAKADAKVSKLSDAVWKSMSGRSWRKGCPVGRSSLRIVRVNYWAFDGYVRRGEIVVNKSVATRTKKIFTSLFAEKTPIRSMYRVDRFGYSKKLRGADDVRSMRADNTSGFNCRRVVGWTSRMSPHATGRSIDINPWENPFRSRSGYTPNKQWAKRSTPASITWRGGNDPVVKVFRKNGFRWLGASDLHHFER